MKIIFCFIFTTSTILAEDWKLNTSQTSETKSVAWKLNTLLKNDYSLETLPISLDVKFHRQTLEQSHTIPSIILVSASFTTRNASMGFGDQFYLETSQANCVQRAQACSRAQQTACSRQAVCQRTRQAACSRQNSNGTWFPGKLLIQNFRTRRANSG